MVKEQYVYYPVCISIFFYKHIASVYRSRQWYFVLHEYSSLDDVLHIYLGGTAF